MTPQSDAQWGARLMSSEQMEQLFSALLTLYEYAASTADVTGLFDLAVEKREQARSLRDLRAKIRPTDKVWILSEPPELREFIEGTTCLVLVRAGAVVTKHVLHTG